MSIDRYIRLKTNAKVIMDSGNYSIHVGEMNPNIASRFFDLLRGSSTPKVIWEPFAGTSANGSSVSSMARHIAEDLKVKLISFGLCPLDCHIIQCDSVKNGPGESIGGMLFHPPYFGSSLMSENPDDLSSIKSEVEYLDKLSKVIDNGVDSMANGSLICAVGRDYRYKGKRIRLDLWYLELFEKKGFSLKEVWISSPDIVLLFELVA